MPGDQIAGEDLTVSAPAEAAVQGAVPPVLPAPAAGQGLSAPFVEVAGLTGVVIVVPAQTKGETVSLKDKPFAVSPARVVFPERHKLVTPLGPREPFFLILHHRRKDEENPILEE
jgi:hypothetical protein